MATYSKHILTGSTHGAPIVVTGSTTDATTTGTTIHDAVAGTSSGNLADEIYLWVANTTTSSRDILIHFGGSSTDNVIRQTIPGQDGLYQVVPGLPLRNTLRVHANATSTEDALKVYGYVNRVVT